MKIVDWLVQHPGIDLAILLTYGAVMLIAGIIIGYRIGDKI